MRTGPPREPARHEPADKPHWVSRAVKRGTGTSVSISRVYVNWPRKRLPTHRTGGARPGWERSVAFNELTRPRSADTVKVR
jgi:hypothetical protein